MIFFDNNKKTIFPKKFIFDRQYFTYIKIIDIVCKSYKRKEKWNRRNQKTLLICYPYMWTTTYYVYITNTEAKVLTTIFR